MVFRVTVAGHSQVPTAIPDNDNCTFTVLRRPGGIIEDFNYPPLDRVFYEESDLVILFIGGNDVPLFKLRPSALADRLRNTLLKIKQTGAKVAFVALEDRKYPTNNRFNINTLEYMQVQRRVNGNLKRFCRKNHIRFITTQTNIFVNNIAHDGVHFNNNAKYQLLEKIRRLVQHTLAEIQ